MNILIRTLLFTMGIYFAIHIRMDASVVVHGWEALRICACIVFLAQGIEAFAMWALHNLLGASCL